MRDLSSEVTIEIEEGSSIESPKWDTSGITSGSQILAGTAGASLWSGEASTAAEKVSWLYGPVIIEDLGISKLLSDDIHLSQSITRARKEMAEGAVYLTHDELFGE